MILHAFTTERYVRERHVAGARARVREVGPRRAPTSRSAGPLFVVTGTTDEEMDGGGAGDEAADRVLRLDARVPHGARRSTAGAICSHELNRLSKQGEWVQMGELVDDEILDTFAVVAEPEQVAAAMKARYGDLVDRILFTAPVRADSDRWTDALAQFKS